MEKDIKAISELITQLRLDSHSKMHFVDMDKRLYDIKIAVLDLQYHVGSQPSQEVPTEEGNYMSTRQILRGLIGWQIESDLIDSLTIDYEMAERYLEETTNAASPIQVQELREGFFKEHVSSKTTDGIPVVTTHPHNLFEWFKPHLKVSEGEVKVGRFTLSKHDPIPKSSKDFIWMESEEGEGTTIDVENLFKWAM